MFSQVFVCPLSLSTAWSHVSSEGEGRGPPPGSLSLDEGFASRGVGGM